MRFVTWLWDQLDIPGSTGSFAKICWDDVNNGCAHPTFSAPQWLHHFENKHPDSKDKLRAMLIRAFQEYMLSLEGK
jgi:hypothetical protein